MLPFTKRLGEQFCDETIEHSVEQPKPYDEQLAKKFEQQSREMLEQEQKLNSARDYKRLFAQLIGKDIDKNSEAMLNMFEQQFGKTSMHEAIEYTATVNTHWEIKSLIAYLLKALQGNSKKSSGQFNDITAEDESIRQLDNYIDKQTKKQMMEIKRWKRNR